jgi:hypothetical protein
MSTPDPADCYHEALAALAQMEDYLDRLSQVSEEWRKAPVSPRGRKAAKRDAAHTRCSQVLVV